VQASAEKRIGGVTFVSGIYFGLELISWGVK
jgi:hypothetical protein